MELRKFTIICSNSFFTLWNLIKKFFIWKFILNKKIKYLEYWSGWFDHWSEKHHTVSADDSAKIVDTVLSMNSSINIYMYHGGTNFGFTNGANGSPGNGYQPTITRYLYCFNYNLYSCANKNIFHCQNRINNYRRFVFGMRRK